MLHRPSRGLAAVFLATLLAGLTAGCDTGSSDPAATTASHAGSGGSATSSSGGAGGDAFVLSWQDDFNTINPSLWQLQTFSWDGNLAQFATQNAAAANGIVSINLTPAPADTVKPFRGVEMRSTKTITYGKVEARLRFAKGSGVVSGLVLIYTPYPADDWNEIDIEHLGNASTSAQLNCQVYVGPPVPKPATVSVSPTQDPQITDFGFDTEADFHLYSMEWTPADVRFFVDGTLVRTWTQEIARMKLPQNILFTIWASNAASWAGAISPDSAPTSAEIDWIKVYDWKG